jgi:uncharacterized protein
LEISTTTFPSILYDESAKLIHDPDHSVDEDRFILLGFSSALRLHIVCPAIKTILVRPK